MVSAARGSKLKGRVRGALGRLICPVPHIFSTSPCTPLSQFLVPWPLVKDGNHCPALLLKQPFCRLFSLLCSPCVLETSSSIASSTCLISPRDLQVGDEGLGRRREGVWPARETRPLPHLHPIFSGSPLIPSPQLARGSFPNGPLDHCPYRPAQVSHQLST